MYGVKMLMSRTALQNKSESRCQDDGGHETEQKGIQGHKSLLIVIASFDRLLAIPGRDRFSGRRLQFVEYL